LRKARVMTPQLGRSETLVRDWVIFSILDEEWSSVKSRLEQRLGLMGVDQGDGHAGGMHD